MNLELFVAAVCFSVGSSVAVWLALNARLRNRPLTDDFDVTAIETRLADLVSELTRIANSHSNAVEDRRNELKRVIEMSNDRIRRLNLLLSDLEIIEKRLRENAASIRETIVEDETSGSEESGSGVDPAAIIREIPERSSEAHRDSVIRGSGAGASVLGGDRMSRAAGGGRMESLREAPRRQEIHTEIRSLAAEGLSPAEISARLRVQRGEVDMVLRSASRRQ
jgi:hypothetical protein